MKKDSKFLQWLKRPRGVGLAAVYISTAVSIAAAIALSCIPTVSDYLSVIAYVSYGLAALLLGYTVYTLVIYLPTVSAGIRNKLLKYKFVSSIMLQYGNKTLFFALVSMIMNIAFAVMNGVSAFKYMSLWYGALAGYYTVLILFRGGLIVANGICSKRFADNVDRLAESKLKIYLSSGAFLIIIEIAMATAITQMIFFPKPAPGGQIMAITSAAYTFYVMTMAVVNLVRARRFSDPVTQSFRNLNFATACMSMLSLTVSLIATFGDGAEMLAVKATVGFAACALTIGLATYMIIKASKLLKQRKEIRTYEQ